MRLLIDGYNLLHESNLLTRIRTEGWLERARSRLLKFLAEHLEPDLLHETTVVFDAMHPPPGLQHEYAFQGVTILFAANFEDADELIIDLIRRHPHPKSLVVVSSDHRIQRRGLAAGATVTDSDAWFDGVESTFSSRLIDSTALETEAIGNDDSALDQAEVESWLTSFGFDPPLTRKKELPFE